MMMYCSRCNEMVSVHQVSPIEYKCRQCGHVIKRKSKMLRGLVMKTYGLERKRGP